MSYEMSERAFLDAWEQMGSPSELYGSEDCFNFLSILQEKTKGYFIIDHFSYINYDRLIDVVYHDPYVELNWVDLVKRPLGDGFDEWKYEIYGGDIISSICDIQKIKFLRWDDHLFVLVMPNVSKMKEVVKFFEVDKLPANDKSISDTADELYSQLRFRVDGVIYDYIIHNLPFYSFLIQPKEHDLDTSGSRKLLLLETIRNLEERMVRAKKRLDALDATDFDEIQSCGNTFRVILESMLKFYCVYTGYNLSQEHYGNNMLGALMKHLRANGDNVILPLIDQDMINLANDLSHDTGQLFQKNDVSGLFHHVHSILRGVYIATTRREKL